MKLPFEKVYLVNLDRCPERLEKSKAILDSLNIEFERVPAVDGKNLTIEALFSQGIVRNAISPDLLAPGALGILVTSILLWQRIARFPKRDSWHLILEDDFNPHPKFSELFETFWNSLPLDSADVILLGSSSTVRRPELDLVEETLFPHASCPINDYAVRFYSHTCGTFAYAITPASAQKLLSRHIPVDRPVDWICPIDFKLYGLRRPKDSDPEFYSDTFTHSGKQRIHLHGLVSVRPVPSTIRG